MRTLFRKASPLLCAFIAAGAAGQIAAPGAARSNHLKGEQVSVSSARKPAAGGLVSVGRRSI
jgi:hypothetical protein